MDKDAYRKRLVEKYGERFVKSLGQLTDRAIGDIYDIDSSRVTTMRNKLEIPSFTKTYPWLSGNKKPKVVVTFADMHEFLTISDKDAGRRFKAALERARAKIEGV